MNLIKPHRTSIDRAMLKKCCSHWISLLTVLFSMKNVDSTSEGTVRMSADGQPTDHVITLQLGDEGTVQSHGFPDSCCRTQRLTLRYDSDSTKGYIHLHFTDLDLPPKTDFKIYNSVDEEPSSMYRDQPQYKLQWHRPVIMSLPPYNVIHMVIKSDIRSQNEDISRYVGFSAKYTVERDPVMKPDLVTDYCPAVLNPMEGMLVQVKPIMTSSFLDKWIHCVWSIKVPVNSTDRHHDNTRRVYVRVVEATAISAHVHDDGRVEIHDGWSSSSPVVAAGTTLEALSSPDTGHVFVSEEGFYISITMPADNAESYFSFVYGVLYVIPKDPTENTPAECPIGFQCSSPYDSWCIHPKHVCNHVDNCPSGADEACDDRGLPLNRSRLVEGSPLPTGVSRQLGSSDRTADLSSTECPRNYVLCPDGSCAPFSYDCPVPNDCPGYNKLCNDGQCVLNIHFCPEEPCDSRRSQRCGMQCYRPSDRCDGRRDCLDGADERNCEDFRKQMYYLILVPAMIALSFVFIYKLCWQQKKPPRVNQERSNFIRQATALHTLQPQPSRHRSPSPNHRRRSPSPSVRRLSPSPSQRRSSPTPGSHRHRHSSRERSGPSTSADTLPPPSYEEVTTTNVYLQPTHCKAKSGDESPPPSYDKAVQGPQANII